MEGVKKAADFKGERTAVYCKEGFKKENGVKSTCNDGAKALKVSINVGPCNDGAQVSAQKADTTAKNMWTCVNPNTLTHLVNGKR